MTETCTSWGSVYAKIGGAAAGRLASLDRISSSVLQNRKSFTGTPALSGSRLADGGRITLVMCSMLIHSSYCSCARSLARAFIRGNELTYCLCRIDPPTQRAGTESPVAPYCVKAFLKTRLSSARAAIDGVNVTAEL